MTYPMHYVSDHEYLGKLYKLYFDGWQWMWMCGINQKRGYPTDNLAKLGARRWIKQIVRVKD